MLIVSRAIAGLGTAGVQSGALTIIVGSVPLQQRPRERDLSFEMLLVLLDLLTFWTMGIHRAI